MGGRMGTKQRLAGIESMGRRVLAATACMLAGSAGAQTATPVVYAPGPNLFIARFSLAGPGFEIVALADYVTHSAQKYQIFHEVRYYTLDGAPLLFDWRTGEGTQLLGGLLPPAGFSIYVDEGDQPVSVYDTSFETTTQPIVKLGTFKYQLQGALGALSGERSGPASYYTPSQPPEVHNDSIEARLSTNGQQVRVSSSVNQDGSGGYTYTYTVTNDTAEPVPFEWRPQYPFPIGYGLPPTLIGTVGPDLDPSDPLDNVLSWSFSSRLPALEIAGVLTSTLPGGTGNYVIGGQAQFLVPVPEPETYAMMLAGLGLLGLAARRRRQTAARSHTALVIQDPLCRDSHVG